MGELGHGANETLRLTPASRVSLGLDLVSAEVAVRNGGRTCPGSPPPNSVELRRLLAKAEDDDA
jgi:hypothetical protein